MQVLLIEPYYGGSHKAWADSYKRYSQHDVTLLTMPAQFWKWRMQGGAVTLANQFVTLGLQPDVILASDMFNLATFVALAKDHLKNIPIALYFHESQFTYPQNSRQNHGWHYAFINYASALAADQVFFNSRYHYDTFFKTLPNMLRHFGDFNELRTVDTLKEKASVLPLGLDLQRYASYQTSKPTDRPPLLLWNHRWEAEKNPQLFFNALRSLANRGIPFRIAITGENVRKNPKEFEDARLALGDRVVQFGYIDDFAEYAALLWQADYVVSTAHQDFFGAAIAEAIYCGCVPILPRRLNYPYLIPPPLKHDCLYGGDNLLSLLREHLGGQRSPNTAELQAHVQQFDWTGTGLR